MSAKSTASQLKSAIEGYYLNHASINSGINVNLTKYDANGTETTTDADWVSSVYYVEVKRMSATDSVSSVQVVKSGTSATIAVDLPPAVMQSAAPLDGRARLKCVDSTGFISYTRDFGLWTSAHWLTIIVSEDCPGFQDKIDV
jgi:hypothetical protein